MGSWRLPRDYCGKPARQANAVSAVIRGIQEAQYDNIELMGERPPLTHEDWLAIADQMQGERNLDAMNHALTKAERALRLNGQVGYVALDVVSD